MPTRGLVRSGRVRGGALAAAAGPCRGCWGCPTQRTGLGSWTQRGFPPLLPVRMRWAPTLCMTGPLTVIYGCAPSATRRRSFPKGSRAHGAGGPILGAPCASPETALLATWRTQGPSRARPFLPLLPSLRAWPFAPGPGVCPSWLQHSPETMSAP